MNNQLSNFKNIIAFFQIIIKTILKITSKHRYKQNIGN